MSRQISIPAGVVSACVVLASVPAQAASVQIGATGQTFASSAVQCAANPATGAQAPLVQAGLFNAKKGVRATVSLNGTTVANVNTATPSADVWLADGDNRVIVALSRKKADLYAFTVQPGLCELPDTSGNTFSQDGSLEYAASGKSYATVFPGCALNPKSGLAQPFVNLFANGAYLLNVSVNGVALTQLDGRTRTSTPVFLGAGVNVISAANGYASTDYYVRDGGAGSCVLP